MTPAGRIDRTAARWALAAFAWTIAISVAWLLVPSAQSSSTTVASDGTTVLESSSSTLLESEGTSVAVVLAVPVVLAGVAVVSARSRRARQVRFVCGGLLLAGCLAGAMSVGLPYAPAAAALIVAGATSRTGALVPG